MKQGVPNIPLIIQDIINGKGCPFPSSVGDPILILIICNLLFSAALQVHVFDLIDDFCFLWMDDMF